MDRQESCVGLCSACSWMLPPNRMTAPKMGDTEARDEDAESQAQGRGAKNPQMLVHSTSRQMLIFLPPRVSRVPDREMGSW